LRRPEVSSQEEDAMSERSTTVLTISRQLGSGGSYIGQEVARRLGMRYADREILQQAAAAAGLREGDLEGAEEKAGGFWHSVAHSFSLGGPDTTFVPPPPSAVYEEDVFKIESRIIREIASQFDTVIVGRAGFHVLAGHPARTEAASTERGPETRPAPVEPRAPCRRTQDLA
jgi:cytidylate kinase